MVTGYTANEYGDQLIASLQDPFQNVIKITDWGNYSRFNYAAN